MKEKATRKYKMRIRGGERTDIQNPYYKSNLHAYFREVPLDSSDFANAPIIHGIYVEELKKTFVDKSTLIDNILKYQKDQEEKSLKLSMEFDKRRQEQAVREALQDSAGSCTLYVTGVSEHECVENRRINFDTSTGLCSYPPSKAKSKLDCAMKQSKKLTKEGMFYWFQDKDTAKAPIKYNQNFIDDFSFKPGDKEGLLSYLHIVSTNEEFASNSNAVNRLYAILAMSILYYLDLNNYESIREVLKKTPEEIRDKLNTVPEQTLISWVDDVKKEEVKDNSGAVKTIVSYVGVSNVYKYDYWLDTSRYPALRRWIINDWKRKLQTWRSTAQPGGRRYAKRIHSRRKRKTNSRSRQVIKR